FAGGFALPSAEAVAGGDGLAHDAILDLLLRLVGKSMLQREHPADGEARYRLLEPVRQYAWGRLRAAGEEAAARRRHCAWGLALARASADPWGSALVLQALGSVHAYVGEEARAVARFDEANRLFRALGDDWGVAAVVCSQGELALARRDYARAEALFVEQRR